MFLTWQIDSGAETSRGVLECILGAVDGHSVAIDLKGPTKKHGGNFG